MAHMRKLRVFEPYDNLNKTSKREGTLGVRNLGLFWTRYITSKSKKLVLMFYFDLRKAVYILHHRAQA